MAVNNSAASAEETPLREVVNASVNEQLLQHGKKRHTLILIHSQAQTKAQA